MQLLNSVAGFFFTVRPVLLIALLWTSCVVNVSFFTRSVLAFTVLPYNIIVSKVKGSTIQRKTEAITPPLVQRSANKKVENTVEVLQQNPIMTQIKYLYINPTFIIWPIKTPPQASKRVCHKKRPTCETS